MKKRFLRLLFLSGMLITLLTSCEYDNYTPAPKAPAPPKNDTISFSQDIQPILTVKCANCHPSSYKPDLTVGNAYNALINGGYVNDTVAENTPLYIKITSGTMAGFRTPGELDLIRRWIYAGHKNN